MATQLIDSILLLFIVLGFGAVAGFFCERVGIINIAIDGQMIFGALMFTIFGMILNTSFPNIGGMLFLVPLLISVVISVFLSLLYGYIIIKVKADHVVVGTAINLVVAGLATFITRPLGSAISQGAVPKLSTKFLPEILVADGLFGETIIITIISIVILAITMIYISKSRFGLRFRAIGDNPNAVDAQGINVNKYKWMGMIISGAFAAIAGSIFMYGGPLMYPQSIFFEGNVAGLGFIALAIVIAGAWRLPFIAIAGLGFSIIIIIFSRLVSQNTEWKEVFGTHALKLTQSIPFILSLISLMIFSRKGVAPKALGKHFNKSLR